MRTELAIYRLLVIQTAYLTLALGHSFGIEISSDAQWTISDNPVSVTESSLSGGRDSND